MLHIQETLITQTVHLNNVRHCITSIHTGYNQSVTGCGFQRKQCSCYSTKTPVRRKEKICLVPVTRPYLFISPGPKLFFHLNTKNFGPIFYSIFKRIVKNVFKALM